MVMTAMCICAQHSDDLWKLNHFFQWVGKLKSPRGHISHSPTPTPTPSATLREVKFLHDINELVDVFSQEAI